MDAPEIVIDARGHRCPVPTLKLRRVLEDAAVGAQVRLLADDPMAKIDVPYFAEQVGARVVDSSDADGVLSFTVEKTKA